MISRIHRFINKHGLFQGQTGVLTAVSGGADSVAMLHVLYNLREKLGIELAAAHLHHGTRARESDADADFVKKLAADLGVRFIMEKKNVPGMASAQGISLEMAAREARYDFFRRAAKKLNCGTVATAHTIDDQAETILLNLARGSGLQGLGGTPREIILHKTRIVRPMLCVTRKDIENYLLKNGLQWREDSSNKDLSFLRNRVRREIMPELERCLNPSIKQTLARTAEILSAENEWLDRDTRALLDECAADKDGGIDIDKLSGLDLAEQRRVIRMAAANAGVPAELLNFDAVTRALKLARKSSGTAEADIAAGWRARRTYNLLELTGSTAVPRGPGYRMRLKRQGRTISAEAGLAADCVMKPGLIKDRCRGPGRLPASASLDISAAGRKGLYLRPVRSGDRFRPLGINGSRKMQDILVDTKVPRMTRGQAPVLECAGEIIWVPGYRVARGWEVTSPDQPSLHITVTRI